MDLELTEEQNMLITSARSFLKNECPPSLMKEMKDDEKGYPQDLWNKMVELGWHGVMIPEAYGGIGGSFLDACIILEAMGEVCCPGPFFTTIILGGQAIVSAGTDEQKHYFLPKIANGELILALAQNEPDVWYGLSGITTKATKENGEYIIDGIKLFVENAHIADYILCVARTQQGESEEESLTLFLVDAKSSGIQCNKLDTLAFDKQCEVVFDKVRVSEENILGEVNSAWDILGTLLESAAVAKCAEMVGGLQTAFNMTVGYAKEREQFGRPIGSFQAVQHHCANMIIDVDGARFITYNAAWKIAEGLPSSMEAAMAKAWTSDASHRVTLLSHQIHGAISFCDEHDMHLYYRKAKAGEVAFGDTDYQLEKVAQQLGL